MLLYLKGQPCSLLKGLHAGPSGPRVLGEVMIDDVLDPVHHEVVAQPLREVGGVRVTYTFKKRHWMSESETKLLLLIRQVQVQVH